MFVCCDIYIYIYIYVCVYVLFSLVLSCLVLFCLVWSCVRSFVCLLACLLVCLLACWLVGWLVGWLVAWLLACLLACLSGLGLKGTRCLPRLCSEKCRYSDSAHLLPAANAKVISHSLRACQSFCLFAGMHVQHWQGVYRPVVEVHYCKRCALPASAQPSAQRLWFDCKRNGRTT